MRLPEIQLDDRRFQDLVSEARTRIARACPEWTEHNVSDPGITLIELFAWMTEMTIYRLNRVPDKLHVALLDLLGIRLDGPSAATTSLRFKLADKPTESILIEGGNTEVGTPRTAHDESVIFQVDEDFTIPAMAPAAYVLQRHGQVKDVGLADGEARPQGSDQLAFGSPPQVGDALYLGFEEPLDRLIVQIEVDASQARGAGVNPEDPPLRWEVSQPDGEWAPGDGARGPHGRLQLRLRHGRARAPAALGRRPARRAPPALAALPDRRDEPVRAHRRDLLARARDLLDLRGADGRPAARHARGARSSARSSASPTARPARSSRCATSRCSSCRRARRSRSRTRSPATGRAGRAARTSSARPSSTATSCSTSSRARSSSARRSARPTAAGRSTAPSRPRARSCASRATATAAGARATSRPATLSVLKSTIAGIDTVTNPDAATGGVDAEIITHARQRASMEIRSRYRAVTAEDFEFMAGEASPRVARAVCIPPRDGGAVPLHLVPRIYPADRRLDFAELMPEEGLLTEVAEYLDERRLIGTTVELKPCRYRGLSVVVNLQARPLADTARVEEDVAHALYTYLNPLVGGNPTGPGAGWPFGRALNQGELYGVVHAVDGVEFVRILRLYETNLETGEQSAKPAGTHIVLEPDELMASGLHIVKATHRED